MMTGFTIVLCFLNVCTTTFLADQVFFTSILSVAIWHQQHFKGKLSKCIRIPWSGRCYGYMILTHYCYALYALFLENFIIVMFNIHTLFLEIS